MQKQNQSMGHAQIGAPHTKHVLPHALCVSSPAAPSWRWKQNLAELVDPLPSRASPHAPWEEGICCLEILREKVVCRHRSGCKKGQIRGQADFFFPNCQAVLRQKNVSACTWLRRPSSVAMYAYRKCMPRANKHLDEKWVQHCQTLHRQKLKHMKSAVDNKPPPK